MGWYTKWKGEENVERQPYGVHHSAFLSLCFTLCQGSFCFQGVLLKFNAIVETKIFSHYLIQ